MNSAGVRIALVVGDTAGHTYPALAVADALRGADPRAAVLFLGTAGSVAASILDEAGLPLSPVPGSPIRRAGPAGLGRAAWGTAQAVLLARPVLVAHGAQLALGFGGFASGGVLIAARTLGLRTAIHEANVEFGLANRWLSPWVDRVFRGLGPRSMSPVGVPIRPGVARLAGQARQPPQQGLRILVMSGSRGGEFFSERLPHLLGRLVSSGFTVTVRQQAAAGRTLAATYASIGVEAAVAPFLDDVAAAYAWADVAIARAGANTIAELAAAGLPAALVPLSDASANHQAANADLWASAGAGIAAPEIGWNPDRILAWLRTMATDAPAWRGASRAASDLAHPDAAARIADACVTLIRGTS